jgi:hypothetical protein
LRLPGSCGAKNGRTLLIRPSAVHPADRQASLAPEMPDGPRRMEPVHALDLARIKADRYQGELCVTEVLVWDDVMQDALTTF